MNKLPLTNIDKFIISKFFGINFDIEHEFKEYFYIDGSDDNYETIHGSYREYEVKEGIVITWTDNPFNLKHKEDNYLILTNKLKYEI